MSEVFSIQISKHGTDRHIWLDLPATAEQVQAAMGQIGVTQDNPWDYFISGFSSPEGRHLAARKGTTEWGTDKKVSHSNCMREKLVGAKAQIRGLVAAWRSKMIEVTKINGIKVLINPDLMELVEETPDTVISFTTGRKIIVKESRQEVKNLVKSYRKDIFAD